MTTKRDASKCYVIDPMDGSQKIRTTFASFKRNNGDWLPHAVYDKIRKLRPGRTYYGGGGAGGEWSITRSRTCKRR